MEDRMIGWDPGRCPNPACSAGTLWVRQSQRNDDLWLVTMSLDHRPFVEAAAGPFCPLCSEDLVPAGDRMANDRMANDRLGAA